MTQETQDAPSAFRSVPRWFLVGFAVAFAAMYGLAQWFSHHGFHGEFVRFHPFASPESLYQPTLDEMRGLVRGRYREGQVLVLVGGNSVFYGVGQPAEKVWTRHLQRELGEGYCVINFAFRGGPIASGASVISEVLREEIPRQILVANVAPLQAPSAVGEPAYQYLNRAAWDRGLLADIEEREKDFVKTWPKHRLSTERAYNLLDGVLRFRTVGNALTWNVLSSYPYPFEPRFPEWLRPRGSQPDTEPDMDLIPVGKRYREDTLDIEMQITRGMSAHMLERDPGTEAGWRHIPSLRKEFKGYLAKLRPEELRPKTLVVSSANSPYYRKRLDPDERSRDDAVHELSVAAWEENGYSAVHYAGAMTEDDYIDRTHLAGTGGEKLARLVAAKIRLMSKELGYE